MGQGEVRDAGRRLSRRELIRRGAMVGGVAVWGAPLVKMAVANESPAKSLGGATLVAFPDTCDPVLLGDPHVRLVCAKNNSGAVNSFKAAVKAVCSDKCGESTTCGTSTACRTNKRDPATVSGIICTETGNLAGCPVGPYARGSKEFSCLGVVICNCECRR